MNRIIFKSGPNGEKTNIFLTDKKPNNLFSRVQTWPGLMDFSERKNPEYDFLQKGSEAVSPVS